MLFSMMRMMSLSNSNKRGKTIKKKALCYQLSNLSIRCMLIAITIHHDKIK